ncbi:MAG: CpaF family protein [Candidatus Diapherotrites archaeon]|nr:CpaF family protein [Candidatus Diapherotrites archaeon]
MATIIESYGNIEILKDKTEENIIYQVNFPDFTPDERNIIRSVKMRLDSETLAELNSMIDGRRKREILEQFLDFEKKDIKNKESVISFIINQYFSKYGVLEELINDDNLEEIMVNGVNQPVFVFHKKYGMCRTNIQIQNVQTINRIIDFISTTTGREITSEKPLMDTNIPDGSRVNVTVPPASPNGPSITIRKFKKVPYNIIELIKLGTLNTELAALLWCCVEGLRICPVNMMIAGGAGSGKTTLLNALSSFIPPEERIITIEDTRELNLDCLSNWVPLESVPKVLENSDGLSRQSLIQNALRMRPNRVLVGEVRGMEAESMFVAMNIGLNGTMGTIHANCSREAITRLTTPPMDVPVKMIPLMKLLVVINKTYNQNREIVRRVTQVSEITGLEGDVVRMNEIMSWNRNTDELEKTGDASRLKEYIASSCAISVNEVNRQIRERDELLKKMVENNVTERKQVAEIFKKYRLESSYAASGNKSNEKDKDSSIIKDLR